jgi:hypothetical protein
MDTIEEVLRRVFGNGGTDVVRSFGSRRRGRMTCREFIDFLPEYLSGELPKEHHAHFDRHLLSCCECAAYLQSYRATIKLSKIASLYLD